MKCISLLQSLGSAHVRMQHTGWLPPCQVLQQMRMDSGALQRPTALKGSVKSHDRYDGRYILYWTNIWVCIGLYRRYIERYLPISTKQELIYQSVYVSVSASTTKNIGLCPALQH
jgi:hypothetical protein